ncbi:hypothetical protein [Chitinophaga sp. 212800010-3]|uniref:hypothetical protein n=1 Tax=unclassified Chitinophaga TaxID=2619133 RepID=UPI002DE6871B|nr:DUF4402 domain-containing protein [Chitinophaga sp. 212800010-3]
MQPLRILMPALLSIIVLFSISCSKDKNDSRKRNFISVKLDNKVYLSENPNGVIYVPITDPVNNYPKMVISGQTKAGDIITLNFSTPAMPFVPGNYSMSRPGTSVTMDLNDQTGTRLTSGSNFTLNLTYIDSYIVEGNFSGSLSASAGASTVQALDGAFRATVKQVSQ